MEEHKHCKVCKKVIKKPEEGKDGLIGFFDLVKYGYNRNVIYYELEVCEICVIKEGIKRFLKKSKNNKPEGMEFGKK